MVQTPRPGTRPASRIFSAHHLVVGAILVAISGWAATPANAALIHDYEFSDPSGAIDSAGSANGTLQGGATISNGELRLNGTSSYVAFSDYLIPTGSSAYSVAIQATFAPSQLGQQYTEIISQGSSRNNGFYIGTVSDSEFRLTDHFTSTGVPLPRGTADLLLSSDASGTRFYIDGTLAFSSTEQAVVNPGGTPTYFGKQFEPYGEYFNGSVSSIRIYDTALTPGGLSTVPLPSAAPMFGAALLVLAGVARRVRPFRRQTAA